MVPEYKIVRAEPLMDFCRRVFENLDVPAEDAHTAAEVLVLGALRGVESHGVARLQRYVKGLKDGVRLVFSGGPAGSQRNALHGSSRRRRRPGPDAVGARTLSVGIARHCAWSIFGGRKCTG
jgi:hypothetical protein